MLSDEHPINELRVYLAADARCGEVLPENDHVWELNTNRGEPPAIALQTTFGLRAYVMRLYPRFSFHRIPVSDPRAFFAGPRVDFAAPNFISMTYQPAQALDVRQKVWVPDSNTLVGQVTLTNTTAGLLPFEMEWIVRLTPLFDGKAMSACQVSVNTVLQGQSGSLFPVFYMTGGPRSDLSAFPGLGIETTLSGFESRQITWALASLDAADASFYHARKCSSYSLDQEQIKIEMLQKQEVLGFDFKHDAVNADLAESQRRCFQLLMPPCRDLRHPFYVTTRDPDQGYSPQSQGDDFLPGRGTQLVYELWEVSRMLLPARPDLVKEMVQNLLDQQGLDGTLHTQTTWNGSITTLAGMPLLASLVLEVFETLGESEWLAQIYPALVRSVKRWFEPDLDGDGDGWPEWQHILQTGLMESKHLDKKTQSTLQILVKTAEWPALAALLLNECRSLQKIGALLQAETHLDWLADRDLQLTTALQQAWDEKAGRYLMRDMQEHHQEKGRSVGVFRQDGNRSLEVGLFHPNRLTFLLTAKDTEKRLIHCEIKGSIGRRRQTEKLDFTANPLTETCLLGLSQKTFNSIGQIIVSGLKKGDELRIETPDFTLLHADVVIPLWAGIPNAAQAARLIDVCNRYFCTAGFDIPLFLMVMWLEGLRKYGFEELACAWFDHWFLGGKTIIAETSCLKGNPPVRRNPLSTAGLAELIPLKTLLELIGIEKMSEKEVVFSRGNSFLPEVNVQYKKFNLTLGCNQAVILNLNGERVIVAQPGDCRIILS